MTDSVNQPQPWQPDERRQDGGRRRRLLIFAAILVAVVGGVFALNAMSVNKVERCQYLLDVGTGYVTDANAPDIAAWTKEYRDLGCRQLAEQGKINGRTTVYKESQST